MSDCCFLEHGYRVGAVLFSGLDHHEFPRYRRNLVFGGCNLAVERAGLYPEADAPLLVGLERGCRAGNVLELGARYAYSLHIRRRISFVSRKCLLEISVAGLVASRAAESGGADRIESCGNWAAGGVQPTSSLMPAARA